MSISPGHETAMGRDRQTQDSQIPRPNYHS